MKRLSPMQVILFATILIVSVGIFNCSQIASTEEQTIKQLNDKGLVAEVISAENFYKGVTPPDFRNLSGAPYKPSYNPEPEIPAQCWIETSYGTQNACKYCHTDYLASINHGNNIAIAEDQILYSFPSAELNRILWQNIIYPQNIEARLKAEGLEIPDIDDVDYVREDNWLSAYQNARGNGNDNWINDDKPNDSFALFPALNPKHLFPYQNENPTNNGQHGYIDKEGFVRCQENTYTGWRAINFFPYAIFTPLTGSVSGIYIRLPRCFMESNGELNIEIYKQNLDILEKNIKNQHVSANHYLGDASTITVQKGFYPVGTEFAHPLHYVDLLADGEVDENLDGTNHSVNDYEFPGTRSKRVKEIRYMYKWKDVGLVDDEEVEEGDELPSYIGNQHQGWIDNGTGWILAAFIENRFGELRPQTTEELAQCLGCHTKVGNTIDAIWSFQRKLPDMEGWADMNYGQYSSQNPEETKLQDYLNETSGMGELGYFYYTVVGADLYGVMPNEIRSELISYANKIDLKKELDITFAIGEILNDDTLKTMDKAERSPRLLARQKLMRHYSKSMEYLVYSKADDKYYVKGSVFYPTEATMKANILGYRKIVLDQSYNLGKDVFGAESEHVPFTFRSDGTILDENGNLVASGEVIYSRPYDVDGVGVTPTGIVGTNAKGEFVDADGNAIDPIENPEKAVGHISAGGTYDVYYNPILSGKPIRK